MYNFQVHNVNLHTYSHTTTPPLTHTHTHRRRKNVKRLAGRLAVSRSPGPRVPDTRFPDFFVAGLGSFYFRTRCHDVASTSWPENPCRATPAVDEKLYFFFFFHFGLQQLFSVCFFAFFVMQFLWGDKKFLVCTGSCHLKDKKLTSLCLFLYSLPQKSWQVIEGRG